MIVVVVVVIYFDCGTEIAALPAWPRYPPETRMRGMHVEDIMPPAFAKKHAGYMQQYVVPPRTPMG